jgi:hypothetical protein
MHGKIFRTQVISHDKASTLSNVIFLLQVFFFWREYIWIQVGLIVGLKQTLEILSTVSTVELVHQIKSKSSGQFLS